VVEEEVNEESVEESGLESADIDVVVSNAGVSRARAVKALRDNKGDIVAAIMVTVNLCKRITNFSRLRKEFIFVQIKMILSM
jgi:NADP-dependent 3-hydroxy acid dehydrogenase YdfG